MTFYTAGFETEYVDFFLQMISKSLSRLWINHNFARVCVYYSINNHKKLASSSVTSKKSPNVYKNCPKNDFTSKIKDFDTFTKLPKNV